MRVRARFVATTVVERVTTRFFDAASAGVGTAAIAAIRAAKDNVQSVVRRMMVLTPLTGIVTEFGAHSTRRIKTLRNLPVPRLGEHSPPASGI